MSVAESSHPLSAPLRLLWGFLNSSIGSKVVMALTGIVLWGYAIGHVLGNIQVFLFAPQGGYLGQQINDYARFLHTTPWLLWGTRAVLLVSFALHIYFGMKLAAKNRMARPARYAGGQRHDRSSLGARFMAVSGIVLLVFIAFHLAHFTLGWVNPEYTSFEDRKGIHDVYRMLREAFAIPWIAGFYIISVVLLFAHLFHGAVSFWQSLGIRQAKWTPLLRVGSRLVVVGMIAAYIAIPIVLFSWSLAQR